MSPAATGKKHEPLSPKAKRNIIWAFWGLFAAGFLGVLILFIIVWNTAEIPDMSELEAPKITYATQVFSSDGKVLTTFYKLNNNSKKDDGNRAFVGYDELPQNLIDALIATEDARFYNHSGIDFQALMRVAVKTILFQHRGQGGGSTITQQLAKKLYNNEDRSSGGIGLILDKLKEWIIAVKLERMYTKEELIVIYLNKVEFGSNTRGIKNASETFFGKLPIDLEPQESAVLVGMLSANTTYNPRVYPEASLKRRNLVLSRMVEAGTLEEAVADSLKQTPIDLGRFKIINEKTQLAPYFREMLLKYMTASEPDRSKYRHIEEYQRDSLLWENDGLYGWLNKNKKADGSKYDIYRDGLRIYSTIDSRMQRYAEEAVAEHLGGYLQPAFHKEQKAMRNAPFASEVKQEDIANSMQQARRWSDRYRTMKNRGASDDEINKAFKQPTRMHVFNWEQDPKTKQWIGGSIDTTMTPDDSIRYFKGYLRAAFMAIEPRTGHIKAYVGGPNFTYFKYDNVKQGARQVGSTIKPFLYTLAMQNGMTPCDEVVNVPQTFILPDGNSWTPRSTDKDETIGMTVTLKWGLTNSSNNISYYLMKQYGPEAMVRLMRAMGFTSYLEPVPSLCVGSTDQNVYEMVAAMNTFPSMGQRPSPMMVTRIEDNEGNLLASFNESTREVIDPRTASLMINLMQGVVNGGTAMRLRSRNFYDLKGEIAGKTGTTNNNTDGWFIGYTPTITAGVWVGGEDKLVHPGMNLGQGAHSALPIWGIWMKKVLADGRLGISESDIFGLSPELVMNLNCTGGDADAHDGGADEEDYFN